MTQTLAAVVLPPLVDPALLASAFPDLPPDELESAVIDASNTIRRCCGWHVSPPLDFDLLLDGTGGPTLFLPSLRVNSVTSVSDNGTDLDPTGIEWSEDGMIRRGSGTSVWSRRFRSIRVAFNSGFTAAELGGFVALITAMITRRGGDPTGTVASKTVGSVSVSYVPAAGSRTALLDSEEAFLAAGYVLPRRS